MKGADMVRLGLVGGVALFALCAAAEEAPVLKGQKEKASYALGVDLGNRLKAQSMELDAALVSQGLKDALGGNKTLLNEEEVKLALSALQIELRTRALEAAKKLGEKNKQEGEKFLTENKTREGVVTLESGLQYKILKAADGDRPTADDTVVCHYRGMFVDGREFDSSYKRSQPTTFPLKRAIKGWTEALPLMPVGSRWQLFIPPALAYGDKGAPGGIGPDATLVFEVELVSITRKS
jgi:FKBP-type peptidyl-prolyl cis-trans isomerase FklB